MAKPKSKPAKKTTKPAPLVRTQGHLGKSLGVARQTASAMLKRDDFPFSRTGPWSEADVETIRQWREAHLQEDRSAHLRGEPIYPPSQPGPRNGAAADEIPGWTRPSQDLIDALFARYCSHPWLFERVALSLIQELDRGEYSDYTHDEDDDPDVMKAMEARENMDALPLVAGDAVERFRKTGELPHLETDDDVEAANEQLREEHARSVDAYHQTMESLKTLRATRGAHR